MGKYRYPVHIHVNMHIIMPWGWGGGALFPYNCRAPPNYVFFCSSLGVRVYMTPYVQ